jgi:hypothetical protein
MGFNKDFKSNEHEQAMWKTAGLLCMNYGEWWRQHRDILTVKIAMLAFDVLIRAIANIGIELSQLNHAVLREMHTASTDELLYVSYCFRQFFDCVINVHKSFHA